MACNYLTPPQINRDIVIANALSLAAPNKTDEFCISTTIIIERFVAVCSCPRLAKSVVIVFNRHLISSSHDRDAWSPGRTAVCPKEFVYGQYVYTGIALVRFAARRDTASSWGSPFGPFPQTVQVLWRSEQQHCQ